MDKSIPYQCNAGYLFLQPLVNFWLAMPGDGHGHPMYYGYADVSIGAPPVAIPYQTEVAGLAGNLIDSGLLWKAWTGDARLLNNATDFAAFVLANGMSGPRDNWPLMPYAASSPATYPYDGYEPAASTGAGAAGRTEPDKIAWLGYWFVKLYEVTGTTTWLNQATHYADVLADHQVTGDATHSPWPFRIVTATGATVPGNNSYTGNAYDAIRLFSELITINQHGAHSIADYTAARNAALTWMLTYPVVTNYWDNCCEDQPGAAPGGDFSTPVAFEGARYLLDNLASDPTYLAKAEAIVTTCENILGVSGPGGAMAMGEQGSYTYVTVSATAHYARLAAMLAKATTGATSATYKTKALRAFNYATYMLYAASGPYAGQVSTGPVISGEMFFRATQVFPIEQMIPTMQLFPEFGAARPTQVMTSGGILFGMATY